jgi:hypothetical protein
MPVEQPVISTAFDALTALLHSLECGTLPVAMLAGEKRQRRRAVICMG